MSKLISVLMPTRGRQSLAQEFLFTAFSKAVRPADLEFILYVDKDDTNSHNIGLHYSNVTVLIGPRTTMGHMNTSCLQKASGQIIVLANDDVVIQTMGWDQEIREIDSHYPDGIYLAYPDDCHRRKKISTFPIMTRRCARILQEPYPIAYAGAFIDTHLFDVFQRLRKQGFDRLHFLRHVKFEHRHYRNRKGLVDETYRLRPRFDGDGTFLCLIGKRVVQAKKLISAITNKDTMVEESVEVAYPATTFPRFVFIFREVFLDGGLPVGWRIYIASFLMARAVAGRIMGG